MERLLNKVKDAKKTSEATEFDAYDRTYDAAVNEAIAFAGLGVDFFTRVKADYLLDLSADALGDPRNLSLLDVGCGVGNYHRLLKGKFGSIAGIDVSAKCLEVAHERHPEVDYRQFDGTRLPFGDTCVDVAFAVCVYHHVPVIDRVALTAEVHRVLKPGAIFAIFEHNPRNPLTMRAVNNCVFDKDAVLLQALEAEKLLTKTGFHDVRTRHILSIPAVGRILRRLDQTLGLARLGAQYYVTGRK